MLNCLALHPTTTVAGCAISQGFQNRQSVQSNEHLPASVLRIRVVGGTSHEMKKRFIHLLSRTETQSQKENISQTHNQERYLTKTTARQSTQIPIQKPHVRSVTICRGSDPEGKVPGSNPYACGSLNNLSGLLLSVQGVAGQDLPVVEHALRECLAASVGAQVSSET